MGLDTDALLGLEDLKPNVGLFNLLRSLLAEMLGVMLIVVFGCGTALNFATDTDLVQIRSVMLKKPFGKIKPFEYC